jgi:hypothetical protein
VLPRTSDNSSILSGSFIREELRSFRLEYRLWEGNNVNIITCRRYAWRKITGSRMDLLIFFYNYTHEISYSTFQRFSDLLNFLRLMASHLWLSVSHSFDCNLLYLLGNMMNLEEPVVSRISSRLSNYYLTHIYSEWESELLYDWWLTANQVVSAKSPLRLTTRIFIFQLNTFSYSPYVISSLTRG